MGEENKTVVRYLMKTVFLGKGKMFLINSGYRLKISKFFLVLTFASTSLGCHRSSEHGLLGLGSYILNGGFGRHVLSNFVRSEGNKTVTICEGEAGNITCPSRTTVVVEDSFYGRKDELTCPSEAIPSDTSCEALD